MVNYTEHSKYKSMNLHDSMWYLINWIIYNNCYWWWQRFAVTSSSDITRTCYNSSCIKYSSKLLCGYSNRQHPSSLYRPLTRKLNDAEKPKLVWTFPRAGAMGCWFSGHKGQWSGGQPHNMLALGQHRVQVSTKLNCSSNAHVLVNDWVTAMHLPHWRASLPCTCICTRTD